MGSMLVSCDIGIAEGGDEFIGVDLLIYEPRQEWNPDLKA